MSSELIDQWQAWFRETFTGSGANFVTAERNGDNWDFRRFTRDPTAATIAQLQAELADAREALKPFADCCDQIGDDEDDDEWAKFRLEVKNYREAKRVATAIEARDWSKP